MRGGGVSGGVVVTAAGAFGVVVAGAVDVEVGVTVVAMSGIVCVDSVPRTYATTAPAPRSSARMASATIVPEPPRRRAGDRSSWRERDGAGITMEPGIGIGDGRGADGYGAARRMLASIGAARTVLPIAGSDTPTGRAGGATACATGAPMTVPVPISTRTGAAGGSDATSLAVPGARLPCITASSASRISVAVAKRSSGLGAIARCTNPASSGGTFGATCTSGVTSPRSTLSATTRGSSPDAGGCPESIS